MWMIFKVEVEFGESIKLRMKMRKIVVKRWYGHVG